MSYQVHMKGYLDLRTLYQIDSLYAWKHGKYFPPVLVEIDPTHLCNQRCIYCYTNKRRESAMLRDDILISCFQQLADAGVKAALAQGTGEPLMHKALPKAIRAGAKRRLTIGLNTNGVLLNRSVQDQLLENLFYVKFSVIDHNPQRYAYSHGCSEKQWKQLDSNIESAIELREERKLQVALWATLYLDQRNFKDAYNIVKFYKEKGLDYIVIQEATFSELCPMGGKNYASTAFSEKEIDEMRESVLSLNDDNFRVKAQFPLINDAVNYAGMTKETFKPDFCHGPKFYSVISADGEVYPCWRMWGKGKEFSYGSLYEKTFEEIWKGEKRARIEKFINNTPPSGSECVVCNHARLNEILYKFKNANSKWKDFVI